MRHVHAVLVLVIAATGCGGSDPIRGEADGGRGGAGGTTNGGDADAVGDGSDAGGSSTDQATCLGPTWAACPEQGACRYTPTDAGGPTRYCYDNGVQVEASHTGSCAGDSHTFMTVRKPDGSVLLHV